MKTMSVSWKKGLFSLIFGFAVFGIFYKAEAFIPPCDPAPSGIVAWWQAEGNADDIIGGNNGTAVGNLTYINGEVGQAFVFDGSTSYITVPASPSLNVGTGSGFTIECW